MICGQRPLPVTRDPEVAVVRVEVDRSDVVLVDAAGAVAELDLA